MFFGSFALLLTCLGHF
ncbi:unnamed protein product [Spodoptera littoralis]|uniref:Uncharacterized protein n=1 Tax=Spodoptera littoralis TaxID=7109 RepID=A0A9P0HXT8_SPOLI|nr:unnamed protein product [Spodoptera littoralis]CAH1635459.1 unnamed protein product [Spodoptera littoralis]